MIHTSTENSSKAFRKVSALLEVPLAQGFISISFKKMALG